MRFAIVGGIGFVIDASVLWALLAVFPSALLLARVPSFLVAATVTWWLHRTYTFSAAPANHNIVAQWFAFVCTNGIGNLVNLVVYGVLVKAAAWSAISALAMASLIAAVLNYVASRFFVFRAHRNADRSSAPGSSRG